MNARNIRSTPLTDLQIGFSGWHTITIKLVLNLADQLTVDS